MGQIERAGEAMRNSLVEQRHLLRPALAGCVPCGTVRMIAGPVLGTCEACGQDETVLIATDSAMEAGRLERTDAQEIYSTSSAA